MGLHLYRTLSLFSLLSHLHLLVFAGRPGAPKVVSASKTCINLKWEPPEDDGGIKIDGYQLEKRKKDTAQWIALNPVTEPIEGLDYRL